MPNADVSCFESPGIFPKVGRPLFFNLPANYSRRGGGGTMKEEVGDIRKLGEVFSALDHEFARVCLGLWCCTVFGGRRGFVNGGT